MSLERVAPMRRCAAWLTRQPGMLATLGADLDRYREFHRRSGRVVGHLRLLVESLTFKAGFQAVLLYRVSHWLHQHRLTWPAWTVSRLNLLVTGSDIEFGARIGAGLLLPHPSGIVIGRGTVIGEQATVFQGVTCGVRGWSATGGAAYPVIGNGVVLFARCSVLGGITVGDRAIVGAHALVTRHVPTGGLAQGVPADVWPGGGDALLRKWGL
ncbi:MAG: serine O-acetyltransferase [Vicinamibacterales bacterium]